MSPWLGAPFERLSIKRRLPLIARFSCGRCTRIPGRKEGSGVYRVSTSDGFSFTCEEFSDAVALADNLHRDSDQSICIIVSFKGEIVYQIGN